jgi:aromatic ring-opening dioxygenase LigB subunit
LPPLAHGRPGDGEPVTVVLGVIAPHGDPSFVEGSPTRLGLEELGRRLEEAAPDVTVVVTPHNVHVERAFAVVTASTLAGSLDEQGLALSAPGERIELTATVDVDAAAAVLAAFRAESLPAVGVSYGSNDEAAAVMPMDWGTLIPLWFVGGRLESPPPVVVLAPARDLSLEDHVRAGAALAEALSGRRAAVLASADHGHAHVPDGPFGFDPAAAEYDERMVELVRENRLDEVLSLESIVHAASADSLWQVAILHGALGDGFEVDFLSYERPTYFGMLCAAFEPVG